MDTRETVLDFVKRKFKDKVDKAGAPYIMHLTSVAAYAYIPHEPAYIKSTIESVALLHDVFEDTDATEAEIRNLIGVDDTVIDVVKLLTRDKADTYMEYIAKVSENRIASLVKIADLYHNMQITRYDVLDDSVFSLLKRYHKAYKFLTKINK
jgi:(p)ppGpp synthase/HD superfamily hydrolase